MQVRTVRSDGCLSHVLIADGDALIVDPARDTKKYHELLASAGATLKWVFDTHTHADHLSGARKLADEAAARLVMSDQHSEQWRAAEGKADALGIADILRQNGGVKVEHGVGDGDTLELGKEGVRFVGAPGHTLDSIILVAGDRAFTGDSLLIGQTGRCDLPGGDGGEMYETLFTRFAALPDATFIYPGHDYEGQTVTALGFERVNNVFMKKRSRDDFEQFLKGAFPSLTGAGMQCGASLAGPAPVAGAAPLDPLRDKVSTFMDGYFFGAERPENLLSTTALKGVLEGGGAPVGGRMPLVLDVREPAEYAQGHIDGSQNLSVHQIDGRMCELPDDRDREIVTICKSGKRSGWAAMFLRVAGYRSVKSVPGGMMEWQRQGYPARTD